MAKKDALVPILPTQFSTGRVQPGTYLTKGTVYALHGKNDGTGAYLSVDFHYYDPDTEELVGTQKCFGYRLGDGNKKKNQPHKKILMAPSRDGKTLAGTDDVDEEMLLNLANGETNFAGPEEEALFSGPHLLARPGNEPMKGQMTQIQEAFEKLIPGFSETVKSLEAYDGYVMDWDYRPATYGNPHKGQDDNQQNDVLVPVELVSKTNGKSNTKKTAAKSAPKEEEEDSDTESESSTNPKEKEVEKAILASIGTDWTAHRSMMSTAMEAFEDLLPDIVKMAKDDDWLYSEARPWEGNLETKKLRKRKK